MRTIEAQTLGEAWLEVSRAVLEHGDVAAYDGLRLQRATAGRSQPPRSRGSATA
jgi:hypothetical protein